MSILQVRYLWFSETALPIYTIKTINSVIKSFYL